MVPNPPSRTLLLLLLLLLLLHPPTLSAHAKDLLSPFSCSSIPLPSSSHPLDLSRIPYPITWSNIESTPPSETRTTLLLDLCRPLSPDPTLPAQDQCPAGTRICLLIESIKNGSTTLTQAIPVGHSAQPGGGTAIDVELAHVSPSAFTLEFPGREYAGRAQRAEVQMVCDPRADEGAHPTELRYERASGRLEVKWPNRLACRDASDPGQGQDGKTPDGTRTPPDGPAAGDAEGWGFWSWLAFLLGAGFVVYMGVGMYTNYNQYGASGWDLVPNRDFWRESPYIAKDAASHVWRSVAGGSGGSGGGGAFGGAGTRGAYEPL